MRVSGNTREVWLRVFGAVLPETIKPFAEVEQDDCRTNGAMHSFVDCEPTPERRRMIEAAKQEDMVTLAGAMKILGERCGYEARIKLRGVRTVDVAGLVMYCRDDVLQKK